MIDSIQSQVSFLDNTSMLFGDAQKVVQTLVSEVKEV